MMPKIWFGGISSVMSSQRGLAGIATVTFLKVDVRSRPCLPLLARSQIHPQPIDTAVDHQHQPDQHHGGAVLQMLERKTRPWQSARGRALTCVSMTCR